MVTSYSLKPRFQAALRPTVVRLAAAGVTANQVTVAALAGSLAVGVLVALAGPGPAFLVLPAWLFLRMALNAVDGMLAREHGQASPLGACLNEVSDVLSDAALLLPFGVALGALPAAVLAVMAAVGELSGVMGQALGGARRYEGPMGKSDRAVVLGALGLAVGLGVAPAAWMAAVLWATAGLVAATALNRVRAAVAGKDGRP